MMHVINSSRLRLGGSSGVEEGNALSLSICMRRRLNRSGRTQGDGSSPRNCGYALPA